MKNWRALPRPFPPRRRRPPLPKQAKPAPLARQRPVVLPGQLSIDDVPGVVDGRSGEEEPPA
jgi:hypothetical protein